MIRVFFSEVGGGRFSRINSLSYTILHVIVQVGGGGVVESPINVEELLPTLGDHGYKAMIL